jgi:hypothetical protein
MSELPQTNESGRSNDFGALVFEETIRRSLRKTPAEHLEMLRASLRDAEKRGVIPKRDRAAHEKRLLAIIEASKQGADKQ